MFRKKLSKIDVFPKYLCTCCWSSQPRRESNTLERQNSDVISARGTADGDSLNQSGAAYAYEDETSSDSDDEVLKRFKSSMETTAALKRSNSHYSQKEASPQHSPVPDRRGSRGDRLYSQKSLDRPAPNTSPERKVRTSSRKSSMKSPSSPERRNVCIDETMTVENETEYGQTSPTRTSSRHSSPPPSRVENLIDMSTPTHSPSHEAPSSRTSSKAATSSTPEDPPGREVTTPMTSSITTGSAHTLEGTQTYNNQAYDGLSVTESEQATDEHMFDVSDLQGEAPLISKCGSLEVTFNYDGIRSRMKVTIHQAQEIPAKERGGANHTQVRLLLLPTKKQRHKTKVKPGDNPMFEETFVFNKISIEDVTGFGLRFRLYGTERMRRERMIGESIIGFASLNLDEPSTHWVILEPRSNLSGDSNADARSLSRSDSASSTQSLQHGGMPELLLGLSYNGTTGRLSVEVIKGSNFRNMAMNRAPDTYVKLTLMAPNGTEVAHSKTSVRRGQPNPLFKETFMFQVAQFQLADVTLMVSVYNKKSMKKKEMIGWFALGLNSSGEEETSHWADMRESKGDNICRWHVLLES